LMSALLPVPGSPDGGPFYLVHGLVNALEHYPWLYHGSKTRTIQKSKIKAYISLIPLLTAYAQPRLPIYYRIPNVDSNDILYGGHKDYGNELVEFMETVVNNVLTELGKMNEENISDGMSTGMADEDSPLDDDETATQLQCHLVLDLCAHLLSCCQLDNPEALLILKKSLTLAETLCIKRDKEETISSNDNVKFSCSRVSLPQKEKLRVHNQTFLENMKKDLWMINPCISDLKL